MSRILESTTQRRGPSQIQWLSQVEVGLSTRTRDRQSSAGGMDAYDDSKRGNSEREGPTLSISEEGICSMSEMNGNLMPVRNGNGNSMPRNEWELDARKEWELDARKEWELDARKEWELDAQKEWELDAQKEWELDAQKKKKKKKAMRPLTEDKTRTGSTDSRGYSPFDGSAWRNTWGKKQMESRSPGEESVSRIKRGKKGVLGNDSGRKKSRCGQRKILEVLEDGFVDVGAPLHEVLADCRAAAGASSIVNLPRLESLRMVSEDGFLLEHLTLPRLHRLAIGNYHFFERHVATVGPFIHRSQSPLHEIELPTRHNAPDAFRAFLLPFSDSVSHLTLTWRYENCRLRKIFTTLATPDLLPRLEQLSLRGGSPLMGKEYRALADALCCRRAASTTVLHFVLLDFVLSGHFSEDNPEQILDCCRKDESFVALASVPGIRVRVVINGLVQKEPAVFDSIYIPLTCGIARVLDAKSASRSRGHMAQETKDAAVVWKAMSGAEKQPYFEMATTMGVAHKAIYPEYKHPSTKGSGIKKSYSGTGGKTKSLRAGPSSHSRKRVEAPVPPISNPTPYTDTVPTTVYHSPSTYPPAPQPQSQYHPAQWSSAPYAVPPTPDSFPLYPTTQSAMFPTYKFDESDIDQVWREFESMVEEDPGFEEESRHGHGYPDPYYDARKGH
ncbi:hypothetical protein FB45DRAFT_1143525 [Roridomyces roridus]|uniref:Uncharacterized protein n=1 Tax=Roridomyces roridus TaxID=1738132 RepID=A0AAD7C228_9AGAR|nr:hypothetical protein FB45DRAFT_1143525 [Roridomyces roridus]